MSSRTDLPRVTQPFVPAAGIALTRRNDILFTVSGLPVPGTLLQIRRSPDAVSGASEPICATLEGRGFFAVYAIDDFLSRLQSGLHDDDGQALSRRRLLEGRIERGHGTRG